MLDQLLTRLRQLRSRVQMWPWYAHNQASIRFTIRKARILPPLFPVWIEWPMASGQWVPARITRRSGMRLLPSEVAAIPLRSANTGIADLNPLPAGKKLQVGACQIYYRFTPFWWAKVTPYFKVSTK